MRQTSLTSLQAIQEELSQKMDHAVEADKQLASLSEQFLSFQQAKAAKEGELKNKIEDLEH